MEWFILYICLVMYWEYLMFKVKAPIDINLRWLPSRRLWAKWWINGTYKYTNYKSEEPIIVLLNLKSFSSFLYKSTDSFMTKTTGIFWSVQEHRFQDLKIWIECSILSQCVIPTEWTCISSMVTCYHCVSADLWEVKAGLDMKDLGAWHFLWVNRKRIGADRKRL